MFDKISSKSNGNLAVDSEVGNFRLVIIGQLGFATWAKLIWEIGFYEIL